MTTFLGIDPGLSGCCALYNAQSQTVSTFDMPTHSITVNKKKKNRIDLYALARWFDVHGTGIKMAVIEEVSSMPGQGVSSSFSFGFSAGVVQAMTAAAFIPVHLVAPSRWKRAMGLTSDKDASRRLASQMFPGFSGLFARVKDSDRAEATLLAVYGSKLA